MPRFRATTHDSDPKKSRRFSKTSFTCSPQSRSCPTKYPTAKASPMIASTTAAANANTLSRSATFVIVRFLPLRRLRGAGLREVREEVERPGDEDAPTGGFSRSSEGGVRIRFGVDMREV